MQVAFDSETEPSPVRLELVQGKTSPFIVPVPENGNVAEEYPGFLIVFGRVPGSGPGRVEEFAHDQRIVRTGLGTDIAEPF